MNVVGIIAEYNPFHNGHQFHLQSAKEICGARYAVCVMSGHFLQRGEPALFDKWSRAAMAVAAGADLVFELPYVYACRSAGVFARGGVALLAATGIVTHLCFGSEQGSLEQLQGIAGPLAEEPPAFKALLQEALQNGCSFPAARQLALQQYCNLADRSAFSAAPELLNYPNNTLGIEYLIALTKLSSSIIPVTLKRQGAGYHDQTIDGSMASATALRKLLATSGLTEQFRFAVPAPVVQIMEQCMAQQRGPVFAADYTRIILACLRRMPLAELAALLDVSEGLEYKLKTAANTAASLESLLSAVKSKRYTRTRIQRILTYCLLNFSKNLAESFDQSGPQYLRVLAFSKQGQELLKLLRKTASLPVIHRPAAYVSSTTPTPSSQLAQMLQFDVLATDLYMLGCPEPQRGGLDYLTGAVRGCEPWTANREKTVDQ